MNNSANTILILIVLLDINPTGWEHYMWLTVLVIHLASYFFVYIIAPYKIRKLKNDRAN